MYDWLAEIHHLVEIAGSGETYLQLNSPGVSAEALARLEQSLGISLPASYKAFLRRWNGGRLGGSTLLSAEQFLEYAQRCGFKPFQEEIEFLEPEDDYFRHKPAHHLVFRTFDLGSDVYCFDTATLHQEEFIICKYDAELALEDNLQLRYPSFEAMMLLKVHWEILDDIYYVLEDYEASADEAAYAKLEAQFLAWQERLERTLIERGADLSDGLFPDWTAWR